MDDGCPQSNRKIPRGGKKNERMDRQSQQEIKMQHAERSASKAGGRRSLELRKKKGGWKKVISFRKHGDKKARIRRRSDV